MVLSGVSRGTAATSAASAPRFDSYQKPSRLPAPRTAEGVLRICASSPRIRRAVGVNPGDRWPPHGRPAVAASFHGMRPYGGSVLPPIWQASGGSLAGRMISLLLCAGRRFPVRFFLWITQELGASAYRQKEPGSGPRSADPTPRNPCRAVQPDRFSLGRPTAPPGSTWPCP